MTPLIPTLLLSAAFLSYLGITLARRPLRHRLEALFQVRIHVSPYLAEAVREVLNAGECADWVAAAHGHGSIHVPSAPVLSGER